MMYVYVYEAPFAGQYVAKCALRVCPVEVWVCLSSILFMFAENMQVYILRLYDA